MNGVVAPMPGYGEVPPSPLPPPSSPGPESDAPELPDVLPDEPPDVLPDALPDEPPDVLPDVPPDVLPDEPPDVLPDEPPEAVPDEPPEEPVPPSNPSPPDVSLHACSTAKASADVRTSLARVELNELPPRLPALRSRRRQVGGIRACTRSRRA
jgi:hypothetical protein